MGRFYANENFPLPVVIALREMGHDVLTSADAGNSNRKVPDEEVVAYATANNRAVLTLNRRDFIVLHRALQTHAGIVVCTFDADFAAQAQRVHLVASAQESLVGQLLRVNRKLG